MLRPDVVEVAMRDFLLGSNFFVLVEETMQLELGLEVL